MLLPVSFHFPACEDNDVECSDWGIQNDKTLRLLRRLALEMDGGQQIVMLITMLVGKDALALEIIDYFI